MTAERRKLYASCAAAALLATGAAEATETVTYRYDALGRLVRTTIAGGPNDALGTATCFDPAGNRARYMVGTVLPSCTAAPAPAPTPTPTPSNTPPVAVGDSSSGTCNVPKTINVLANDYDPDGHTPLSLVSVTPANNTGATIASGTSVTVTGYAPGTEFIAYVVQDSLGATATGRLTYTTANTAACFQ